MTMSQGPASRLPVFVIGTRAQLIKVAPVMVACERRNIPIKLLMTGQHQETMQDLLEEFGVAAPIDYALAPEERATMGALLRWLPAAYSGLKSTLQRLAEAHGPLDVVVHGDTLSTVIGALAARRTGNRVLHLESGLTSGRLLDPFPEEISRRLVFRLADVAFCPTADTAKYMALRYRCEVVNTLGNTIEDAVALSGADPTGGDRSERYVVASLHRFQNLFNASRLRFLVELIEAISNRFTVHFVLHPATRKRLAGSELMGRLQSNPNIKLSPRLGYRAFLSLAARADCVLTNGGSNQEELSVLGVPTIVMRDRTERQDGLKRNAMMESDVPGGVQDFFLGDGFLRLRHVPIPASGPGPSDRIADFLASSGSP